MFWEKLASVEGSHLLKPSEGGFFTIQAGEVWGVIGGNGSGKSTLAQGLVEQESSAVSVSFEEEMALLEREIREDDTDFLDRIDPGRTVGQLIDEVKVDSVSREEMVDLLQLNSVEDRGFRLLSTGERRRLMLARALSQEPKLLILDEPYDGLDVAFQAHLRELIDDLSQRFAVVLVVNRLSDLGDSVTHLAYLHDHRIILAGERAEVEVSELWEQLQSLQSAPEVLPGFLKETELPEGALVEMRKVTVHHGGRDVLSDFDWTIEKGQNWKVSGPNGCGKSTLVNLISGDHPQCYSNHVTVFGLRRGSGESIWDIKKLLGIVSSALHQQYRVNISAEAVVLSGFFDSIGLYEDCSIRQRDIAHEWLELIHLKSHVKTPWKNLSYGQQRLLLIARALVKRPPLLILDEPCQGLDPMNRALVLSVIDRIALEQMAQVVYITHEAEDRLDFVTHEIKF